MADILTLSDARAAIRVAVADTSNDADLSSTYVPAVTSICESIAGPIMTASLSRTYNGGAASLPLPSAATSVTSLVQSGVTLSPATDYTVDLVAGLVYCGLFPVWAIFMPGLQTLTVNYTVGYAAASANVRPDHRLAARIILRHLWQADQQGTGAGRSVGGMGVDLDVVGTPTGYLIPHRAFELLRPSAKIPGFA